jgi:heme o synthase
MIRGLFLLMALTKFKISLFATLSACAGFILSKEGASGEMIPLALGILLLACGSCGLNQYQEREIDGRMERTKRRPLPAGKMHPLHALLISFALIACGFSVLLFGGRGAACLLGLFAVFWYNGVYFCLKKRTAWAILPGALIGAVPPAMGWVAGEGNLWDRRLIAVCLFFFIWQVPHFYLLLLLFSADYEKAGLPTLARRLTAEQLQGITFVWILSTAAFALLIPLFFPVYFAFIFLILLSATFWLVWKARSIGGTRFAEERLKNTFGKLNVYAFLVLAFLSLDRILSSTQAKWHLIAQFFSRMFPWV